jgi:hypothetical protein
MTNLLGLSSEAWAPGNYYKYAARSDLRSAGPCGEVSDACTFWPDVHTTLPFDEHELVHLYARNEWKPALLAEGAAEGLTCRSSALDAGCTNAWRDLLNAQRDRQTYDCGARLVYQLLVRGEPAKLTALAAAIGGSRDPDVFAGAIQEEYGVDLDTLWQTLVLTDSRRCVRYFKCAGPELALGTTPVDDPEAARFRLPKDGGALVHLRYREPGAESSFQIAACRATLEADPEDGWSTSGSDVWLETRAGAYALVFQRGTLDVTVEEGSFATQCATARRYSLEPGRTFVLQLRSDGRTLYFPIEMEGPRTVEHVIGGFPAPIASASFCRSCTSECTALDVHSALAEPPILDDGVIVVQTTTEPASTGFLRLRMK